jgi:hypothetical protein
METLARDLAEVDIATLRYQFPFLEQGSKRPDPPAVAMQPFARRSRQLKVWHQICLCSLVDVPLAAA